MSVCTNCKDKEHCKGLPGICLKLPCILAGLVAIMLLGFILNSTL